jgi:hypothetical protein
MDYYIYKIACKDPSITDVYIGSTKNPKQRIYYHKSSCINSNSNRNNLKIYQFIRDNGGWENWEFIIIETIFCNNKKEVLLTEKKWIIELSSTLNTYVPARTYDEYRETHKERIKKRDKQYYETHKEQYNQYQKEYRETHADQIKTYKKQYYEKNKSK